MYRPPVPTHLPPTSTPLESNQTGTLEDSTEQENTSFTLFITSPTLQFQEELPLDCLDELTKIIYRCLYDKTSLRIKTDTATYFIPYEMLSTSIIELVCE